MKEKKITDLKVEPFKEPCICILGNELESLQKAVSIDEPTVGLIGIADQLGY